MFPGNPLACESWHNVCGLFLPLLNDIAFDLISTATITTFADAKEILLKRFGKTST